MRKVTKHPTITRTELGQFSEEMREPVIVTSISAALHQSGLCGKETSQLSKRNEKACVEFARKYFERVRNPPKTMLKWLQDKSLTVNRLGGKR